MRQEGASSAGDVQEAIMKKLARIALVVALFAANGVAVTTAAAATHTAAYTYAPVRMVPVNKTHHRGCVTYLPNGYGHGVAYRC